mmetsp:Transcript_47679/g.103693  ORF Transcript_47679/g.103693 Transcript_47679/m.103693 type:complete len:530 (-) Transcript_47679:73-1662(-)|eukprot:CAMPEP_0170602170 /NCGR_PEP_ID=MMETSP0224-20130122/18249_1 /TAXON_ID=285029 /ORGANISM="Togula jolla, Strain CCCM 725" /LENGTH=529 /DNA_ID=CAMNT_0010926993 /DNA_START=54 /DNA_END=1643 /DNA_ORIENTATION=+
MRYGPLAGGILTWLVWATEWPANAVATSTRLGEDSEGFEEHNRRLSANRYDWVLVNRGAGFSKRYAHAAVLTAQGQIFVIGGAADFGVAAGEGDGHGYLNDVWVSEDHGSTWHLVTPRSERFGPRRGHSAVMNSNGFVIFLLGGFCGKDCFMNDWWSSENGAIWQPLGKAPWSARHGHVAVISSKEKLVLLGGHDGDQYLNDVWSIQDPAQALVDSFWTRVLDRAPWEPRYGHAAVINDLDEIFLMGGFSADKPSGRITCFNDVWRSRDDGKTWTLRVRHAPWSGRYQHVAQISNGKIFIVGGLNSNLDRCNDVWRSDEGKVWHLVTASAPWAARYEHAAVTDSNSTMYIMGGMSTHSERFNDVWRSERTCADDVHCSGVHEVCRDGSHKHFEGQPNPICVDICDRRIFEDCNAKQVCHYETDGTAKAVCIDPCAEKSCDEGEVCEVAPRGAQRQRRVIGEAEAYCLACNHSMTKYACDKLLQCEWSPDDEACEMKCSSLIAKEKCTKLKYCKWTDNECKVREKPKESD